MDILVPKVITIEDNHRKNLVRHSCGDHDLYWNVPASKKSLIQQIPDSAPNNAKFDLLSCPMGVPTLLYGKCRRTGAWRLCRIFEFHRDSFKFTVMWTDGTLQNRMRCGVDLFRPQVGHDIEEAFQARSQEVNGNNRPGSEVADCTPACMPVSDESKSHETEMIAVQGMTIWEAVRQGNLFNVLYLIDFEGVSPSAVYEEEPHTPLYWAVTKRNVECVRELLERGACGEDAVEAASLPPMQTKSRPRRRPYSPGTIQRWGRRSLSSDRDHAMQLIRAMIKACRLDLNLPPKIYRNEQQSDCIVCFLRPATAIGLPCAHLSCCRSCLEQSPRCPICRTKVLAIAE